MFSIFVGHFWSKILYCCWTGSTWEQKSMRSSELIVVPLGSINGKLPSYLILSCIYVYEQHHC